MNFYQAIFLGVVQGLTEFFPVSSSGHLVITQSILPNFEQPGVLFDVILHVGTLMAIFLYFGKNIFNMFIKYWKLLIVGTIPAGLIGFFAGDVVESLFSSSMVVGFALLVTGVLNLLTNHHKNKKTKGDITNTKSPLLTTLVVGTFQSFALVPGISRSGSTIFAGIYQGVGKKEAAEFSFLLSVPAILGAMTLQMLKYSDSNIELTPYVFGFLSAFVSGYIAIKWVIKLLERDKFKVFAYYCFILGLLTIFLL